MTEQAAPSQEAPSFAIEKLYVKDLSLEVPNAPEIYLERDAPEVNIQLQTGVRTMGDGVYEVTLTVTVTAKLAEKTVFLVEAGQAGIFRVKNVPEENLQPLLSIACPNILFPYARQLIDSLLQQASLPPLLLPPVNFDVLLQQSAQDAVTTH